MYEHHTTPLLPWLAFFRRLIAHTAVGLLLIGASLGGGMIGYHRLEGLAWIDAFTNAAMILSGMGPLANPATYAGKIFAGCYALYSGFLVILVTGIIFAPIVHRFLHHFHHQHHHPHP
jgi:hypothetical protein